MSVEDILTLIGVAAAIGSAGITYGLLTGRVDAQGERISALEIIVEKAHTKREEDGKLLAKMEVGQAHILDALSAIKDDIQRLYNRNSKAKGDV